ncbi:2-oxoglutarate dehydrogenase complex E2 component [Ophidiomyces ophidiicola]|nr:2-oxoglutarate dehydrogenase complex E2 component [Ophidiomyces ophidiicola]
MKFAHRYSHTLESEGFPILWVHSAISYRQLKKCIKRVSSELAGLGLQPEVLHDLWLSQDQIDSCHPDRYFGFHYEFSTASPSSALTPKLTFISHSRIKPDFLSSLYPKMRENIGFLLCAVNESKESHTSDECTQTISESKESKQCNFAIHPAKTPIQAVDIPLSSDSEFFRILRVELSTLRQLQDQEREKLTGRVKLLRETIVGTTNSTLVRSRSALDTWREIFRLYMEAQVFFSTNELDSGERTSIVAHQQLVKFQTSLSKISPHRKLRKNGRGALKSFLDINFVLLQNLKFQEINRIALRKILKKFDKRTALRAYPAFPLLEPLLSQSMANILCQTLSQEILSVIPQIHDYLCPICFNVAFKPVRLRCGHVFCIRCLVIMQRAQQDHCALCRREVVMEATSAILLKISGVADILPYQVLILISDVLSNSQNYQLSSLEVFNLLLDVRGKNTTDGGALGASIHFGGKHQASFPAKIRIQAKNLAQFKHLFNALDGQKTSVADIRKASQSKRGKMLDKNPDTIIKVPQMAESISEGTLKQFSKQVGDFVERDEELATIETDKIDVTVNAPASGIVKQFLANEEDTVTVGQDLVKLEQCTEKPAHQENRTTTRSDTVTEELQQTQKVQKHAAQYEEATTTKRTKSNPPTEHFPVEVKEAISAFHANIGNREERRVKMNRMRLRIAERLKQSQNTAASLTTFNEVDMSSLMELRKLYKEEVLKKTGAKLGFMSAFARACVLAMKEVPAVNASIEGQNGGDTIVYRDYVDISIAVATQKGLVTPVVRNVEGMDLITIEKAIADLGQKARDNKLTIEDMAGGTFTISNGGVFGSLMGTPIINLPQTGVLGLHAIKNRPIAVDGRIEIRPMMFLALTYDHRLLDGREAVTFLVKVKEYIEDPRRMLLM